MLIFDLSSKISQLFPILKDRLTSQLNDLTHSHFFRMNEWSSFNEKIFSMKTQFKLPTKSFFSGQEKRNTTVSNRNERQISSRFLSVLTLFLLAFFLATPMSAQQKDKRTIDKKELEQRSQKGRIIKGIVVENGEALPGVSVELKDTRRGTETNENGIFEFPLALLNGDVLVFKFLGLKTKEVTITSKTTFMRVTMVEDSEVLELIVLDAPQTNQLYKSKKSKFKKKNGKN